MRSILAATWTVLLAIGLSSCGESVNQPDLADIPGDSINDPSTETQGDTLPETPGETGQDVTAGDVDVQDLLDDSAGGDIPAAVCTWAQVPKTLPDANRTKFGLTMFHWNTQYVAGGLLTTWDGQPMTACGMNFGDDSLCEGWDDDAIIDWQITQSFEPILDMYLSHPTWRTTFECPGLMIEAMEARHPDILAKLQAGVQSGQIEMVSFHWSAQLFLAYPARDLEKSLDINAEIFQRTCLPVSPVVFNQEGMSGLGKHSFMKDHGFTVDLLHENMFRYFQWGTRPWPRYTSRGVTVLAGMEEGLKEGPSVDPESGIDVIWPFFDDGEVLATVGSPYLAPISGADMAAVKDYENMLQLLVDKGYQMTTITGYLADLDARQVAPRELPPIVDSTWQPIDTEGIQQWMGHHGSLDTNWPYERDNDHRTATYRVSQSIAAVEVLLKSAKDAAKDVSAVRAALDLAWRDLLRAEVSDATGINPWPGEFVYGMTYSKSAQDAVDKAFTDLLNLLGWPHTSIDVGAGTATRLDDLPVAEPPEATTPPFEVSVVANGRTPTVQWFMAGENHVQMHLSFGPMTDPSKEDDANLRKVQVTFPRYDDVLRYTPGLSDNEVIQQPLSGFTLQSVATSGSYGLGDKIFLPLPNGLIGLGNDWWVIKHCDSVHLAAVVPWKLNGQRTVSFLDETAIPDESRTWVFSVFQGTSEQALAIASRINTFPTVLR